MEASSRTARIRLVAMMAGRVGGRMWRYREETWTRHRVTNDSQLRTQFRIGPSAVAVAATLKVTLAFALWGGPRIEQVQQEAINTAKRDCNRSVHPATAQKEEWGSAAAAGTEGLPIASPRSDTTLLR